MELNETYSGARGPDHIHENEEEIMLFQAGHGMVITDDEQTPWSRFFPYQSAGREAPDRQHR